jgi:hypothetical protein
MPSTTQRYSAAASQPAGRVEKIADFWTQRSRELTDYMLPGLPQVDLVPVVERYFEFVQRTVDTSRDLTLKWAEAAGTLSGAVREQAESARDFVHEQAGQAELSDLLDQRNLPKTGNVDELVERLAEACIGPAQVQQGHQLVPPRTARSQLGRWPIVQGCL